MCCAGVGAALGTPPTSPRATGEREANYLETECVLFRGSLGTLPTSPRATARPLRLPWSFYHGAVSLPWWHAAGVCEANHLKMALSPVDRSSAFGVLPRGTGGRKIIALLSRGILSPVDRSSAFGVLPKGSGGRKIIALQGVVKSRMVSHCGLIQTTAGSWSFYQDRAAWL